MHAPYQKPNFFQILIRDRLAAVGLVIYIVSFLILLMPIFFKNMYFSSAIVTAVVISTLGDLFTVPRFLFLNRLFETGIPLRGEVLFKLDSTGRRGGAIIKYSYTFEGNQYQAVVRTHMLIDHIIEGTAIDVIVDPRNPHRSILPMMYVQSVGQQ